MRLQLVLLLAHFLLTLSSNPTHSTHRSGPHGLSGWTINDTIPDQGDDPYPLELVIARNGRVTRQIQGDPFVWQWMFLRDGKRIAYQTGPLHFALECVLLDIDSGKTLQKYDCFHEPLALTAPRWVRELKNLDVDWNK